MTGFDNGPKDGDFVRYIEALSAARTVSLQQSSVAQSATGPSPFAAQPTSRPSSGSAGAGSTRAASAPSLSRISATQADAIAGALLRADGTVGPREWGWIAALAIGVVLLLVGLVAASFNAVFFAAGAALLYWTVGRWVRRAKLGADSPRAGLSGSLRR